MLTIGDFSLATRLTVKALRIYHEDGLLVPERVDALTGYRYYGDESLARAKIIVQLREFGFPLAVMKEILSACRDDADLARYFSERLADTEREIEEKRRIRDGLRRLIEIERESAMATTNEIIRKEIAPIEICSIRYKGAYSDCGQYYGLLYKKAGRWAKGAPFMLNHDGDYKEADADVEVGFEVKKRVAIDGLNCRVLSGGSAITLVHRGSYETLGDSYRRLYAYVSTQGLHITIPSMELYLKGPGLIFPRNPKNYLTEIRIFVE